MTMGDFLQKTLKEGQNSCWRYHWFFPRKSISSVSSKSSAWSTTWKIPEYLCWYGSENNFPNSGQYDCSFYQNLNARRSIWKIVQTTSASSMICSCTAGVRNGSISWWREPSVLTLQHSFSVQTDSIRDRWDLPGSLYHLGQWDRSPERPVSGSSCVSCISSGE